MRSASRHTASRPTDVTEIAPLAPAIASFRRHLKYQNKSGETCVICTAAATKLATWLSSEGITEWESVRRVRCLLTGTD